MKLEQLPKLQSFTERHKEFSLAPSEPQTPFWSSHSLAFFTLKGKMVSLDRPGSAEKRTFRADCDDFAGFSFCSQIFYKGPQSVLLSPVDVLTCLVYQNVPLPVRLSPNPGTSVWLRTLAVRKYIPSALVLKPADNSSDTPTSYCQSPAAKVSRVQGPDEITSAHCLHLPMWQVLCCFDCFQLFSFGSPE